MEIQKEFPEEIRRKLNSGDLVLCDCGHPHSGKHLKCLTCRNKKCDQCGCNYSKGGGVKLCSRCTKRRNALSIN